MEILDELERAGAIIRNRHFVYTSGKHAADYINIDPILPNVTTMKSLVASMLDPWLKAEIETIAAPAVGAIELAVLAAAQLTNSNSHVSCVWADKDCANFRFKRAGFISQLRGKRVLVLEDLLNTGGSVAKLCREAEHHGAQIVGVSVICNRGSVTASQLGVPILTSLADVRFDAYEPASCPLCARNVPIVEDVGHGDEFRLSHPDYPGGFVSLIK